MIQAKPFYFLAESSKTLSGTYSEYQNLGSLVHISKGVITQLEASDWFDRLLLAFGLFLFSMVVLYIIKKRTWDVGISWVSWLTQTEKSKAILQESAKTILAKSTVIETISTIVTTVTATAETVVTTALYSPVVSTVLKDEL